MVCVLHARTSYEMCLKSNGTGFKNVLLYLTSIGAGVHTKQIIAFRFLNKCLKFPISHVLCLQSCLDFRTYCVSNLV